MKYDKKSPCNMCPFTRSTKFEFDRDKAIALATQDGGFACHKTAEVDEEEGAYLPTKDSQACAGRLIMLERCEQPDQMMRIAGRLGLYDPTKLKMDHPDVFDDIEEFVAIRGVE